MHTAPGSLRQLARLYNVQTAYYDMHHHRRTASAESLLAVLQALGAPLASLNDVPSALREREISVRQRVLEPVTVAWDREYPSIKVRLPEHPGNYSLEGHLELESGEQRVFRWSSEELTVLGGREIDGISYAIREIRLPEILPRGYHRFFIEIKGNSTGTLVISAPHRTYSPPDEARNRKWGTFLPLYAMPSQNSWGSGDYSSLESLADQLVEMGGSVIATLPLLPVFLDEPFEPSPYAPVSRLMWNEFYLDVNRVPELARCPAAQKILQSNPVRAEITNQQAQPLVDYRRQMSLKRRILEELSRHLLTETSDRSADFQRFIQANPVVEDYARFRATMEKQRSPWPSWPERLRDGILRKGDYEEKNKLYYIYAQWLAQQQVRDITDSARRRGVTFYFDLPLGTHSDGFDVWRERNCFVLETTTGAPPDAVFTRGQDWGFPPLHPDKIREDGYRYIIAYLRHHLQHAGMLRIDHVMGLNRFFWIPKRMKANQGVYVRYRAEELYAILTLESHRHRSIIVGEDLGTVPPYIRPEMARHGLHRMYVLHYELACNPRKPLGRIPGNAVASLNTHDMPTFTAFWQGLDIKERQRLGLLSRKETRGESQTRQGCKNALVRLLRDKKLLREDSTDIGDILRACLLLLSASQASTVLVNLEDLWLETQPQNMPGTGEEYPNWQKKARYLLEHFCRMPEVRDTLNEVDKLRKQGMK